MKNEINYDSLSLCKDIDSFMSALQNELASSLNCDVSLVILSEEPIDCWVNGETFVDKFRQVRIGMFDFGFVDHAFKELVGKKPVIQSVVEARMAVGRVYLQEHIHDSQLLLDKLKDVSGKSLEGISTKSWE